MKTGRSPLKSIRSKHSACACSDRREMLAYVAQNAPDKINHFRKSYSGSLRSAITAMCLSCRDFTEINIRECNREFCPLWEQRPYREARPHRNASTEKTNTHGVKADNHERPG